MLSIRKSEERGHANHGWLDARHSFSFANYYDPQHMGFSDLRVINEDRVAPTMGFGTHPHKNMEILTYVLNGSIAHKDSMGNVKEFHAGEFQIMSAGSGVTHSEFNPSDSEVLHLLQIWIMPNELNIAPRYDQKRFADQHGGTLILSPNADDGSFKVYQDMKLWRYQYATEQQQLIDLDVKRVYWLQMVKGKLTVNGQSLAQGDAIAVRQEQVLNVHTHSDAEFLLFDLRA
ncbi:pirin family protein [Moraxella sp. ZY210820]|uniref:pirin family protein n=1 Tax=unclassified Moraxella TaxID=2685852 RepID=UPI00272F56C9|nr:pirin family protein [Moraxella sp. ZY210820]WLF84450.1 pirin family protein [Moraxella sp. ZY210820]